MRSSRKTIPISFVAPMPYNPNFKLELHDVELQKRNNAQNDVIWVIARCSFAVLLSGKGAELLLDKVRSGTPPVETLRQGACFDTYMQTCLHTPHKWGRE